MDFFFLSSKNLSQYHYVEKSKIHSFAPGRWSDSGLWKLNMTTDAVIYWRTIVTVWSTKLPFVSVISTLIWKMKVFSGKCKIWKWERQQFRLVKTKLNSFNDIFSDWKNWTAKFAITLIFRILTMTCTWTNTKIVKQS